MNVGLPQLAPLNEEAKFLPKFEPLSGQQPWLPKPSNGSSKVSRKKGCSSLSSSIRTSTRTAGVPAIRSFLA